VVVLLFGLFMEAYMHDFNLVYILLFFVFSLAFSAGPIGLLNLGNLEAVFKPSGRFFAQQESMISLSVQNTSQSHSWSIYIYHNRLQVAFMPTVKAHNTHLVQLPYTAQKRGDFVYDTCYLESKYPLSTVRFTREITDKYHGIAYPQPKGLSLFAYIQQHNANWGEEKEFDGLRVYDGSQRLSHIHWASVAKGELSVKHFSKEAHTQNLHFNFETLEGNPETRLSQLCLWVLECEKHHLPFSVAFSHKVLHSNKEGIDEILIWLAHY
jgi:uncharacterized protein (DUF58 family)